MGHAGNQSSNGHQCLVYQALREEIESSRSKIHKKTSPKKIQWKGGKT